MFDLNGRAFRHRLIVVEGKPLLILGNDFLDAHGASISLNEDGEGRGTLTLQPSGIRHQVPVSTRLSDLAATAAPVSSNVPADTSSHVRLDGSLAPSAVSAVVAPSAPEPIHRPNAHNQLSAEDLAREHLATQRGEYLLYAEQPIVLPARSKRTVWVRAPHVVVARGDDCLVDRLPPEMGRDSQPLAELSAVRPTSDGLMPVTLWNNTNRRHSQAALTPIAALSTEWVIHDERSPREGPTVKYDQLAEAQRQLADQVKLDPQNRLTPEQLARARDLIAEFIDVFAVDP